MARKSVLVIDDDDAIIKLFELIGRRMDIHTVTAPNGAEGFNKFKNQEFDLVVTDLDLPKMNGVELIQKVQADAKKAKTEFIVVTAALAIFQPKLKDLKNVTVLEKPIKVKQIQDIYRKKLGACLIDEKVMELEELKEKLSNGFKLASTILLDWTTKDRPKVKDIVDVQTEEFFKFNFGLFYPSLIGGNPLILIFLFDKSLAKTIKDNILKKTDLQTSDTPIITGTLRKLMYSFLKKLLENAGFGLNKDTCRHNPIIGSNNKLTKYQINPKSKIMTVTANNKYGTLTMHVIKEI